MLSELGKPWNNFSINSRWHFDALADAVFWFLGYSWQYSGVMFGSLLRYHSWKAKGPDAVPRIKPNWICARQISYLLYYPSSLQTAFWEQTSQWLTSFLQGQGYDSSKSDALHVESPGFNPGGHQTKKYYPTSTKKPPQKSKQREPGEGMELAIELSVAYKPSPPLLPPSSPPKPKQTSSTVGLYNHKRKRVRNHGTREFDYMSSYFLILICPSMGKCALIIK